MALKNSKISALEGISQYTGTELIPLAIKEINSNRTITISDLLSPTNKSIATLKNQLVDIKDQLADISVDSNLSSKVDEIVKSLESIKNDTKDLNDFKTKADYAYSYSNSLGNTVSNLNDLVTSLSYVVNDANAKADINALAIGHLESDVDAIKDIASNASIVAQNAYEMAMNGNGIDNAKLDELTKLANDAYTLSYNVADAIDKNALAIGHLASDVETAKDGAAEALAAAIESKAIAEAAYNLAYNGSNDFESELAKSAYQLAYDTFVEFTGAYTYLTNAYAYLTTAYDYVLNRIIETESVANEAYNLAQQAYAGCERADEAYELAQQVNNEWTTAYTNITNDIQQLNQAIENLGELDVDKIAELSNKIDEFDNRLTAAESEWETVSSLTQITKNDISISPIAENMFAYTVAYVDNEIVNWQSLEEFEDSILNK